MQVKEIALSTIDLTVGYSTGESNILFEHLNLSLHKGELVCFMGPNGIGKSTLIRTLSGSQAALSGKVNGVSNKNAAVVLTDKIAPGMMTVKDLVTYGRYPYLNWNIKLSSEDSKIIDEAIGLVHINKLVDKPLYELSDGQLQMAMIARALAQDTPVLLLDEPTAHLDLNNRVEIMNLLRKIAKEQNKAVLVSTHELDLALQTADKVWVATPDKSLKQGIPEDLVLDGTFDQVFQFKGFDLKTGKVSQIAFRQVRIQLNGEGPVYLWTKNALERNGYEVVPSSEIQVIINDQDLRWGLIQNKKEETHSSLSSLLTKLESSRP